MVNEKVLKKAKPHLDALKGICEEYGCEMEDLMESEPEEEGEEEMEMGKGYGPGPDKGKVALIIAKMKKPEA